MGYSELVTWVISQLFLFYRQCNIKSNSGHPLFLIPHWVMALCGKERPLKKKCTSQDILIPHDEYLLHLLFRCLGGFSDSFHVT